MRCKSNDDHKSCRNGLDDKDRRWAGPKRKASKTSTYVGEREAVVGLSSVSASEIQGPEGPRNG